MNQANLDSLKTAKRNLQKVVQDFSNSHLNNEEGHGALDGTETDFAKWYYGEGKVFKRFSSYVFLESFYNDLLNSYNEYFDIKQKPIQKGFFSDGVSKRKSELDGVHKKVVGFGQKLFSAIDMFVHNVERSKIIERATKIKIDSEPQEKPSVVVESLPKDSNLGSVKENIEIEEHTELTNEVSLITNQNDKGVTEEQSILLEDEQNAEQKIEEDAVQKEKVVSEIENDLEVVPSEVQGETIQNSQTEEENQIEESFLEEDTFSDTTDSESKEKEVGSSVAESDLEVMKRQLQEDFDKMLQSIKDDSKD